MQKETRKTIFTIGHSNRTRDQFLELLLDNEIDLLADVRRYPASRRYPHFNKDQLNESTGQAGIEYLHLPALGGRRGRAEPDSPNNFWRVESFQAYADYMGTDQAQQAIKELSAMSDGHRMAIMCSEAVPWRCHRRLIADILVMEGNEVINITGPRARHLHEASHAIRQLKDGTYIWPASESQGELDF